MVERGYRAALSERSLAFLPGGVRFFDEIDQCARLGAAAAVRERKAQSTRRSAARISLSGADNSSVPKTNTTASGFRTIKQVLLRVITSKAGLALSAPVRPRCASVLFLHRFAVPDLGVEGHDPAVLRRRLEYLRKHRYELLSVGDLIARLEKRNPPANQSVLFTVDDGYVDFATVAAPIFAAYDCPVTVFLITDFTSGKLWNWFDRVPWMLAHTSRDRLKIEIGGAMVALGWENARERDIVSENIIERLKRIPDDEKERIIAALADSLDAEMPAGIPERDRAMTWDEVRGCAARGVTFGPHTVRHPILSRVDANRSRREIGDSWRDVSERSGAAVPVFCYPNGTPADFSLREENEVRHAGMRGAFSTVEASVQIADAPDPGSSRFAIPRFVYPDTEHAFVQAVSGIEALRGRVIRL